MCVSTDHCIAQSISGQVTDEQSNPVPFANIFVKELNSGASADAQGKYYLTIDAGAYSVVISSVGYQPRTLEVVVKDKELVLNVQLLSYSVQLDQVEVRVRRRDPAYEIIQKVIDNRSKFLSQIKSSRTSVYLRASETMDVKKKEKRPESEPEETGNKDGTPVDPFEEARKKEAARLERINLVEMELTLNYQYPNQYKEERTAFKTYGTKAGLFIPLFDQTDFNFYHNLVHLKGISEIPMISPISRTAILSYKYKLEQILKEGEETVYKIKVTPRKTGDATGNGYLFINDSTWNINRLELTLHKGALKFYDDFTIRQAYQKIAEDLWIPYRQEFDYQTRTSKQLFKGSTVLIYSDFEKDYVFPPKFFGNEVSVTTEEAYKRDTSYWKNARPEPLTADQQKVIRYRDSVEVVHRSKKYLDSMQAKFNKVTIGEVLYGGVGFRNESRQSYTYISPLVGLLDFAVIGGFRFGPSVGYFQRYKNQRWIDFGGGVNVGVKNLDWQGTGFFRTRYDPFRQGEAGIRFGREFQSINSFDAYLNQLKISNYIRRDVVTAYHLIELVNGFYVTTTLDFSDRASVSDYDRTSVLNEIIDEVDPIIFEGYQALISNIKLAYVPKQRYMREPNQKVILGSKYPTFFFNHKKGWNGIASSDIDFDFINFGIEQQLQLGTIGNSRYTLAAGKFVNTRDLRYADLKRFRQSDPYLYSDPMHSFQLLDTSLVATNWFIEGHYMHAFNGALINNIPLVKKLRLRTVAGAGFMWIKESSFRHQEMFGGIERVFKLGARRRLKLGFYGVISQSNFSAPKADWKISIDLIDTWKRNWSY